MASNDIRTYIDILEGRQPVKEGIFDKIAGALGNKKAKGREDVNKASKMMMDAWKTWLGRTSAQGNTNDMLNFLTNEVDFTKSEAKDIMGHFTSSASKQHQDEVQESYTRRLYEAPAIPLSDGQARTIFNYAIKYAYANNVWNTPGHAAQSETEEPEKNEKLPERKPEKKAPRTANDNGGKAANQNEPEKTNDNKTKPSGTVLSNLRKYGFDSEDVQDMSWQIRNGDITPSDLTSEDIKKMATVGWAYLKSLQY